jgi:predicted transposase YbfD/YdcC
LFRQKEAIVMPARPDASIEKHFGSLKDPRIDRTKRHKLLDILVIAVCAVICGADGWTEVADFGRAKEPWFRTFLDLPNGIPSHDTFGRVFAHLDPSAFTSCFLAWIGALADLLPNQVIPVDGKTLRRSHDRRSGKAAIHMVSAWAAANQLVLGQVKVNDKSNEITAIPELLQALALEGCIVTIDAMGCQKEIAAIIVDKGADYLLALKENQGTLYDDVVLLFDDLAQSGYRDYPYDSVETTDKGHGRVDVRQCWTIAGDVIRGLPSAAEWTNLRSVVKVRAERHLPEMTEVETRYYISSLKGDAKQALHVKRTHWSIENALHWVLDIAFREDESRVRKDNGPENFAILRHIALSLLKQDTSHKAGIKGKRLLAGWDEAYLLRILSHLLN